MIVLSIDPGTFDSAYTEIDVETRRPLAVGKVPNQELADLLASPRFMGVDHVVIEMVASYGMPVGEEVFETVVWIGRYEQMARDWLGAAVSRRKRIDVKSHHCHAGNATDANITQALVDRFAMGLPNRGKGTKAEPGWFFGFAKDIWQAYALGVLVADELAGTSGANVR